MRGLRAVGVILDSSFVFALYAEDDKHHEAALTFMADFNGVAIVPEIILPEVTFLFQRTGGTPAVIRFLEKFNDAQDELECLTTIDLRRAKQIMEQYREAKLDLVDCCIAALAERLYTPRVATFDHRDFGIIRPGPNIGQFEILP